MIDENSVITAVSDLIEAIQVDSSPLIKEVFDHIPAQFTKYPSVYVVPASWEEDYIDLRDTGNTMVLVIGVVYTLSPDMKEGQYKVRTAAKIIRETLGKQANIQLSGTVDWSMLTSGTYTYDTREQKIAICEMRLTVRSRHNRYE